MTNHVHLIVNPGSDPTKLGLLMKRLAGRPARINCLEWRTGTAWDGRFKCSPTESASYLLASARHVDPNPVRACVVKQPEDYPWSSYRARIGLSDCSWLDPDPCFLALAPTPEQRSCAIK